MLTHYPMQQALTCYFMRGGSSRGGFFLADELPEDPVDRAAWLLTAYGSPDTRQIDGIGGADPLTSKAAIVGKSTRPDADVDYTFCQIGIDQPRVSTGGNCGNMLAAVGPFAILRGLVPAQAPETVVRIHTTNTRQVVTAHIPVMDGFPAIAGDCAIAGVPGTSARIMLDFGDCGGSVTGKLLPTGSARDVIMLDGRRIEVSFVDAATPFVFVRAADVGATGTESPVQITSNAELMRRLERIRGWAAEVMGLVEHPEEAAERTPNIPRIIMVAAPTAYQAIDGRLINAGEMDLAVRQLAMQKPHKALAVTGAVCTAVASAVADSIVAECMRPAGEHVRLGHPSGVLQVAARVSYSQEGEYRVREAQIERTARLIMAGQLFLPEEKLRRLREAVAL